MNFSRVMVVVKRTIMLTFRGIDPLTDFFYWPLFDIILWGFASTWIASVEGDKTVALVILASLVLWQACYRSNMDISFNLLQEMWSHNLINLFVTPLTVQEWVASVMITGALNSCIAAFFGALAVSFLYNLSVISIGWVLLPLFLMLAVSGWAIGLFCASGLIMFGSPAQKLVWVMVWFFTPFSGIYYPVEAMPGWAQVIAYSTPMSYFFRVFRIYCTEHYFDMHLFAIGALLNVVYFAVAISVFLWLFHRSRTFGLARLEGG